VNEPHNLLKNMSWSFWLILLPTLCYGAASVAYGIHGKWPMAVVYAGYCFANTGLLALDLGMAKG
jgi:hypothetical protein